jgi:hypothetical protein
MTLRYCHGVSMVLNHRCYMLARHVYEAVLTSPLNRWPVPRGPGKYTHGGLEYVQSLLRAPGCPPRLLHTIISEALEDCRVVASFAL